MSFRLNDMFSTIQGEGYHAGTPAIFFRFPHCNLKCEWCDTDFNHSRIYSLSELKKRILGQKIRFAVITGGEPTMNKECSPLVDFLHSMGFFVAVESNGCFHITQDFDWVTISPKRQSEDWQGHTPYYVHPDNDNIVDEVKYVVDDDFDFKPCLKVWPTGVKKYLSPEFNNFEKNVARIMAFIKEHPEWKLSLQTHKWINVP